MWEWNDKNNYANHVAQHKGQISDDAFARDIQQYAAKSEYKSFLEIGTWNGLGSTKAFVDGFKDRTDDFIFYSLECNKDKWADASKLYAGNPKLQLLNEVLWNEEPRDFYTIFPQCLTNSMYKHWNEVDLINMKKCNVFLNRPNLPEVFDVVLLDGGEFTTYYEFQLLKKRCKILMLDDIAVDKCKKIVAEIEADPQWHILKRSNVRNGYLIAENIIYK
jgi:hypothetical protein